MHQRRAEIAGLQSEQQRLTSELAHIEAPFFSVEPSVIAKARSLTPTDPRLVEQAGESTNDAAFIVTETRRYVLSGSGTVVGSLSDTHETVIVTAAHVVDGARIDGITVVGAALPATRGRVVAVDAKHDIALVGIKTDQELARAMVTHDLLDPGALVVVTGGSGSEVHVSPAIVVGSAQGERALVCSSCSYGDSGAGIFDKGGAFGGVLVAEGMLTAINPTTHQFYRAPITRFEKGSVVATLLRHAGVQFVEEASGP